MDTQWDFSGRSGIVTGAASGIGAALAVLLARSGAAVALVDRGYPRLGDLKSFLNLSLSLTILCLFGY